MNVEELSEFLYEEYRSSKRDSGDKTMSSWRELRKNLSPEYRHWVNVAKHTMRLRPFRLYEQWLTNQSDIGEWPVKAPK